MFSVNCPSCGNRIRSRSEICLWCGAEFLSEPILVQKDNVPLVYPVRSRNVARLDPMLIGLALLPLAIPMLWLLGPFLSGKEPIFSFAAPVAVAIGTCGLALGIAFVSTWSIATRIKGVLILVLLSFLIGGFLFFIKREWAEQVRRSIGTRSLISWQTYRPSDNTYQVSLPTKAEPTEKNPFPKWNLSAVFSEPRKKARDQWPVQYLVAHGTIVELDRQLTNDAWFDQVKESLLQACEGAEVTGEKAVNCRDARVGRPTHPGREFRITLADGTTNRIVRIFRDEQKLFYLAVEGAFLLPDTDDVAKFFADFSLYPGAR